MDFSDDTSDSIRIAEIARLLIEHRAALMGYLVSCLRNHSDADDLFQEVSLVAIQSANQLRSSDGFLPWTREIARRRVLAHFRKSKRLTPIDPELVDRLTETAAEMDGPHETPARIEALHSRYAKRDNFFGDQTKPKDIEAGLEKLGATALS